MPLGSLARVACVLLTLAFAGSSAFAQGPGLQAIAEEVWSGHVTEVTGADTLVILYGSGSHQFELDGIRPPRGLPALTDRAAASLRERLVGKSVQVRVRGYLDGGRVPTGVVLLDGVDVRIDLVAEGLVAYCPRHVVDVKVQEAQRLAKEARRGLWGRPSARDANPCDGAT
jgi:endonuclease YncB( thermonuclease family)